MKKTPKSYYMDEARDGFYIPGMMKRAWAVHLKNYQILMNACKKVGASCEVMWGTMIGVVRSGGFIPWDDDVDMMMSRQDYDALCECIKNDKMFCDYHIRDFSVTGEDNMVRSLWDSEESVIHPDKWDEHLGFMLSSAIDIFVLDRLPSDAAKRKEFEEVLHEFVVLKSAAYDIYVRKNDEVTEKQLMDRLSDLERRIGIQIPKDDRERLWISILEKEDEYLREIDKKCGLGDDIIEATYYWRDKNIKMPSRWFDAYVDMPFEHLTVSVPIGYDAILRKMYGNYACPVLGGGVHGYPFYSKRMGILAKEMGDSYPRFNLWIEIYKYKKEDNDTKRNINEELSEVCDTLSEAHSYLSESLNHECVTNEVLDILLSCQELAIHMGNDIESRAVEPEEMVHILEEYCEDVFKLNELCSSGVISSDQKVQVEKLLEYDKLFRNKIVDKVKDKKRVVFLVYRSEYWDAYDSIWKRMSDNPAVDVTVIKIPYFYKDHKGEVIRDELVLEDDYPEEVVFTPYDAYDVRTERPDIVFYQDPYDEYEEGISIHPYFYSSSWYPYVGKMVLVMPFELRENEAKTGRLRYALSCYLNTPGALFADEIYVRSEKVKDAVEDILCELTKDNYSSKTYELPSIEVYDFARKEEESGESLCVHFSGSVIYEHGKNVITKTKRILEKMKECKYRLSVIWFVDHYSERVLGGIAPDTWNEYMETLLLAKKDGVIKDICVEDVGEIVKHCGAFYGDVCIVMDKMRMKGKPILWETPTVADLDSCESRSEDRVLPEVAIEGDWFFDEFLKMVQV